MARSSQPRHALDADSGGARALDARSHRDQQRRQVGHFRLARAVFHHGFALGERCGHHQFLGAGDGDAVPHDVAAAQPLGAGFHIAVVLRDGRTQVLEALDVQVDGTRADGASAGQGDARATGARHQRTQHQRGRAHRLHQFVRGFRTDRLTAVNAGAVMGAAVTQFDLRPHLHQQLAHGLDVAHLGDVLQHHGFVGEQRRCHRWKRGILGAADAHRPYQWIAAADYEFVHE